MKKTVTIWEYVISLLSTPGISLIRYKNGNNGMLYSLTAGSPPHPRTIFTFIITSTRVIDEFDNFLGSPDEFNIKLLDSFYEASWKEFS
jgi:hypothetical protein